jgi:hypothetical protein
MTTKGTIVVVGDVIDDIIVRPLREIRVDTDTPALIERSAGGSSANTAAWLGSIGADVHFFGRLGAPDVVRHTAELERFGVVTHLEGDTERPTGTIVIIVEGENRTMLTDRGANVIFDLDTVPDDLIAIADFLHFTGHTIIDEPKREAVVRLIGRAKAHGATMSVDPASAGFITDFGVAEFMHLCARGSTSSDPTTTKRVCSLASPTLPSQRRSSPNSSRSSSRRRGATVCSSGSAESRSCTLQLSRSMLSIPLGQAIRSTRECSPH